MAVIENLDIVLGARTDKLDRGLDVSRGKVTQFKSDVGGIGQAAAALMDPAKDLGDRLLDIVPAGRQAASAFKGIVTAFSGFSLSAIAFESSVTATQTARASKEMREYARAATAGAAATAAAATASRAIRGPGRAAVVLPPLPQVGQLAGQATVAGPAIAALGPIGIGVGAALAAAFVATAAAVKGVSMTIEGVREQLTEIDNLSDSAKKLGVSFGELASLRFALELPSGLDAEAIDAGLQKMILNLHEAKNGGGELDNTLNSLGLNAGDLLRDGPLSAMQQIAQATQRMQDPTDQLALAYSLFGKQGAALVSALREGPDALKDSVEQANKLNLILTDAQAEQVGAANDAWGDVSKAAQGAFRQIAAEVAPVIAVIGEAIVDVVKGTKGWEETLPAIIDGLALAAGIIVDIGQNIASAAIAMNMLSKGDFAGALEFGKAAFDTSQATQFLDAIKQARAIAAAEAANKPFDDAAMAMEEERQQLAEAANRAKKEQIQLEEQNRKAINDTIGSLQDEVDQLRMGAEAFEQMKLAQKGANQFELAKIQDLKEQRDQLKALEDQRKQAQQLKDQLATPEEKMQKQQNDIQAMLQSGALDIETARRAMLDIFQKNQGPQADRMSFAGAFNFGSVQAFSQALQNSQNSKQANMQEQQKRLIEQQLAALLRIDEKLGGIDNIGAV